jgi:hypothetical protein
MNIVQSRDWIQVVQLFQSSVALFKLLFLTHKFGNPFRETMGVDEAEVLAGRYKSVSGRYYVLHDPEKFTDKCITAWKNFGIDINDISAL